MSIIFDSFKTGSSEKADGYQTSGLSFAGLLDNAQQSFKLSNDVIGSASASAVLPGLELTDVGRATASIGEIGAVANPANSLSFLEGDKRDGGQGSFELTLNPVLPPARLLNRLENTISGGDDGPSIPSSLKWEDAPLGPLPRPYDPTGQLSDSRVPDEDVRQGKHVNRPSDRSSEQPARPGDQPHQLGDQPQKPGDGSDKPKDPVDNVLDKLSKDDLKNLVKQLLQDRQNQQHEHHEQQQQQPHNVVEELLRALQRMFQQQHSDQPTVTRVPKNGRGSEHPQEPEQPAEQPEQPAERTEHSPEQYRAAVKAMEYFQANKERLKNLGKGGLPPTEQEMKDLSENLSALKAVGWQNELKSTGLSAQFLDAAVTVFGKGAQTTSSDTVVPRPVDMPSTNHAPNPAPIYA